MPHLATRRQFLRTLIGSIGSFGTVTLLAACTTRATETATTPAMMPQASTSVLVAPTLSATTARNAAIDDLPPLIFVHGNSSHSALWLPTIWRCESAGWPRDRLFAVDFPFPTARDDDSIAQQGRSGTEEQREQLAATVTEVLARTGAAKVALIGSSRGGNAIRNLLKNGGSALVSHAILCGTPNHGAYVRAGDRNEFNGAGPFLQELNAGSEVVPGVAFLTIRSDKNDLYAQPGGGGHDGPALAGATNVVLPGVDHNETATSQRAFATIAQFLTGGQSDGAITPEAAIELNGRVTGFDGSNPTNLGVGGVAVTVYEVEPLTGERRGSAQHARTTDADGVWGPFVTRPAAYLEFVVAAPGQPARHFFRSPFPRSSPYVGLRLWPDGAQPDGGTIVFTRPRGYVATGRDDHALDGKPVPGVPVGLPTAGSFRITILCPERAVPAALNGETMTVRTIPGAITYAEFHY